MQKLKVNHGLIKPVKKGETSSFKRRQCIAKIKLMLVEMPNASRNYKKEINKQHKLYFKDFANKLRNMKSKNPKVYWEIIKESRGDKDKEVNTINTNTFLNI